MTDSQEKPEDCDACHYETDALTRYDDRIADVKVLWLCDLCAGTPCGTAARWPRQYGEQARVLQTICYVGNALLEALDSKRRGR
jgi:mannose/fructose-specific phosphotransferase system component IIA